MQKKILERIEQENMDRVYSQDERIRRAEEIYARRQNLRIAKERTRRATVNVNDRPKNLRLFKRLILQIIICVLIYFIFYLINTTSYSFSENVLENTRNLLSKDTDFYGIYSTWSKSINDFLNKNTNSDEQNKEENIDEATPNTDENSDENSNQENTDNSSNENNMENAENNENIGSSENTEDESLTQTEIAKTEESDIERIKHTYSFGLPVSRMDNIRVW